MSDEKVYVGNAKKITTQYGELMKLSITAEDVEKMQQNLDNGWINIVVKERRSPSAGGGRSCTPTHHSAAPRRWCSGSA